MFWTLCTELGELAIFPIMTVAYWTIAVLLATLYLFSGGKKAVQSRDQLRPMMGWVDDVPLALIRAVGVLEVLGAIGLVVPPLVDLAPGLAIAAAVGLLLVQVGGIALHVSRREFKELPFNVVLLALAGAAVWLGTSVLV